MGVQTDDSGNVTTTGISEELRQTITSHLWLTNLEVSAAIAPTMSVHPSFSGGPHPDGPTQMTMEQLADAQWKLDQAHQQRDISKILKGIVTNTHCPANFSREAGLTPYLGHAHYIYAILRVRSHPEVHHQIAIWSQHGLCKWT